MDEMDQHMDGSKKLKEKEEEDGAPATNEALQLSSSSSSSSSSWSQSDNYTREATLPFAVPPCRLPSKQKRRKRRRNSDSDPCTREGSAVCRFI